MAKAATPTRYCSSSCFPWARMELIHPNAVPTIRNPHRPPRRPDKQGATSVKRSTKLSALTLSVLLAGAGTIHGASRLNVMATTEDLAALAREVGGDKVNVDSI